MSYTLGSETCIVNQVRTYSESRRLATVYTWFLWNALGCSAIPIAILLADPGLISHQKKTIITDVDCPVPYSCSIKADHTIREGWAINKSSFFTFWIHCSTSCGITKACQRAFCIPKIEQLWLPTIFLSTVIGHFSGCIMHNWHSLLIKNVLSTLSFS